MATRRLLIFSEVLEIANISGRSYELGCGISMTNQPSSRGDSSSFYRSVIRPEPNPAGDITAAYHTRPLLRPRPGYNLCDSAAAYVLSCLVVFGLRNSQDPTFGYNNLGR